MPIMVTGGIRKHAVAIDALQVDEAGFGVDMLGIGRAMAFKADLPNAWRKGECLDVTLPRVQWKNKTLAALAVMAITKWQLSSLSKGGQGHTKRNPVLAVLRDRTRTFFMTKRYKRWRKDHRNIDVG